MKDYIELTKPRITWLILMSTAVGYFFGVHGAWSVWSVLHTIVGTTRLDDPHPRTIETERAPID